MSVRKQHTEFNTFYYYTFTCYRWISLFELTNFYDYIYRCFNILKSKNILTCGYVIMPNHLHSIVFTKNDNQMINNIIGETKRFMAYELISRLKKQGNSEILNYLEMTVYKSDSKKKKLHNVFEPSADIKEILTEKFMRQKLNYIHKNPVSGKWNLVDEYVNYIHSSAGFYELGRKGVYDVIHYEQVMNAFAESSAQGLF